MTETEEIKATLHLRVVIGSLWSRVIWKGKVQCVKLCFWTLAKTGRWLVTRGELNYERKNILLKTNSNQVIDVASLAVLLCIEWFFFSILGHWAKHVADANTNHNKRRNIHTR